jgi:uncharacterized protein
MPKKKDRIIIDTNLWISYLLSGNYISLDKLFADQFITLLFSETLLNEFTEVARRPKFRKYFAIRDLENLFIKIKDEGEFIEVTSDIQICRDPKDNFLLSLAKDGKATYLITGDKDLLDIKIFGRTKIVTIRNYLSNG